jgi:hypothetical protein
MVPGSAPSEDGGSLYVNRSLQGWGRHDNPSMFGALYASRRPESAVAERIKPLQGRILTDAHFVRADQRPYALATLDDEALPDVIDLDDPEQLLRLGIRPSMVATQDRAFTQPIAASIFEEGGAGLGWWSTLEASWANVTLFAERTVDRLQVVGPPVPLNVTHPMVLAAAEFLGIRLAP